MSPAADARVAYFLLSLSAVVTLAWLIRGYVWTAVEVES